MQILLLTLNTFSQTGGIQQFNRCLQLALVNYVTKSGGQLVHFSLGDATKSCDIRYGKPAEHFNFKGFSGQRARFIAETVIVSHRFNLILFGHINLTAISLMPGFGNKDCRLIVHGVEVWQKLSFIKKLGLLRMNRVMSVSQFTADVLKRVHHFVKEKIDHFPNCLDPFFAAATLPSPASWNKWWRLDTQRPYILTLARLQSTEKAKGYDTLIELLPTLLEQMPEVGYLLAGKSDTAEYTRIRQLTATYGVEDKVLMPGFVASENLPALYSLAKVFVMPSEKEGFGIVYLEAAWWGCAVVAYDAGGVSEALLNGEIGTLVPAGNKEALCRAVIENLKAPPFSDAQKNEVRVKIANQFGFQRFEKRLHNLLEYKKTNGMAKK